MSELRWPASSSPRAQAWLPTGPVSCLLTVVALYLLIQVGADAARSVAAQAHGGGSWQAATAHHGVQLLLGLALIGVLGRERWAAFGLTLAHRVTSWRLLTRGFFPVLLVSLLAGHILVPLLQGVPPERFADGVPDPGDLAGRLAFALVLVGVSEEVVFRGLFHTTLARGWHGTVRVFGLEIPTAGIWSAAVFTAAHIGVAGWPPHITHLDVRQLILAFVLGLFYAVAYHRTGSLLAPIIAHNAVDGGIVIAELGVTLGRDS